MVVLVGLTRRQRPRVSDSGLDYLEPADVA